MARITAKENVGGMSAVIAVDGNVVGGITMTGPQTFTVETGGQVPDIDGLTGESPRDAWNGIVAKVQAGSVVYHAKAHIGPYETE